MDVRFAEPQGGTRAAETASGNHAAEGPQRAAAPTATRVRTDDSHV